MRGLSNCLCKSVEGKFPIRSSILRSISFDRRPLLTRGRCVISLSSVIRWVARAVTIFALCCAIGLQWLALQSIAWTAMIVDYSKQDSICRAIAKTLDGAHPCSICHVVNRASTAERKADLQQLTPKIDMICASRTIPLFQPFVSVEYTVRDFSLDNVGRSPPVPPPRSVLG